MTLMNLQSVLANAKNNILAGGGAKTVVVVNKDGNRMLVQLTPNPKATNNAAATNANNASSNNVNESGQTTENQDTQGEGSTVVTDLQTTSSSNACKL